MQIQYIFIHNALSELVLCGETEIPIASLNFAISTLSQVNEDGDSGFKKQFQVTAAIVNYMPCQYCLMSCIHVHYIDFEKGDFKV